MRVTTPAAALAALGRSGAVSLLAAVLIVGGVLAVATFPPIRSAAFEPMRIRITGRVDRPAGPSADSTGPPQVYVGAGGLRVPTVYRADIEVRGWRDRGQRILDASIRDARPLEGTGTLDPAAPSVRLASDMSGRLRGRRALVSVTRAAAARIPRSGAAVVRLVVLSRGPAATLVIDDVIGQGPSVATPTGAVSGVSAAPASAPTASAQVRELSAYFGPAGTRITIAGTGFGASQRSSWVTCCGARATAVSWSATSVAFTVPTSATRAGYVGVVVNGATSNGLFFIPFAQPTVDEISPREGAPGSSVTLRGHGFGRARGDGWVTFAGSTAQVVAWSDTEIRVIVPQSVIAGFAGVVTHGLTSNGVLFAPYGAPLVEGVSSRRVTVGDSVTLRGRSFGSATGDVVFAGRRVTPDRWSPDAVTFTVPSGARSGYAGLVRGSWTSNGVYVTVAPRLSTVSGWWAEPGGRITLTGVGFGSRQSDYLVSVGGSAADIVDWSDRVIHATVPAGAPSGYVGVGNASSWSNGLYLVVEKRATISSVTPVSGGAGTVITIVGSDFGAPSATSRVLIGGTSRCAVSEWTATRIVATVPSGAASGYVGVDKQGVTSNGVWLAVTP